jgi:HipA-like C-terminal domain
MILYVLNLFKNHFMVTVEQLIAALRTRREVPGRELASLLGISAPTLSRLVTAAGEGICQVGRARATRYTLTRSLPNLGTRLPVRQVDESGSVRAYYGVIHLLANGRHWLEREEGADELFEGLPHFARDMSPQGYMGRNFSALYPELGLPQRINDWSDDHRLIALAMRGEDCVGDLIIGDESLNRFFASTPQPVQRDEYAALARLSLIGQPGSSAAGEQPKFTAYVENRHVLVKFAAGEAGAVTQRWQDLLISEREALRVVRAVGIPAASAKVFDIGGGRFLETDRFDRTGSRGRRGLMSLFVLGVEYLGHLDNWTKAAQDLLHEKRIDGEDARRIRWLDAFGQLIGNTDRHFGNLSFFVEASGQLRLAPVYDMLPMIFAPQGTSIVERRFDPSPPTADNFDVWSDAARNAAAYWATLAGLADLTDDFRNRCSDCQKAVETLASRVSNG